MAKGEEIPQPSPAKIENKIHQTNLEHNAKEKIERLCGRKSAKVRTLTARSQRMAKESRM